MQYQELLEALRSRDDIDLRRVERAYHVAEQAHRGQKRKSGEDYITHPLSVAKRLADLGADEETIMSAILHDVIEDTSVSLADVRHRFGNNVAALVEGMTKFEKHSFDGQDGMDEKIETIRKWLSVMQTDLRIAIIKLTDRLDNLATLHVFENPEKRKRIAEETLDVYSKVAEWLSLYAIKYHLEEGALPYVLEAESYEKFQTDQHEHQGKTAKFCRKITKIYSEEHTESPTLFKPLTITPLRLSLNRDIPCEIICLAPTEADCYQMLAFFHGRWRRKHGSFADFINTPRVNGYQALHTTIIFEDAEELTIRIMTEQMYDYSQNGVISFIFSDAPQPPLPWIEKLSELLQTNREKSLEFWRGIHSDLFEGFIPIHGPHGKTVSLPRRSTYLDAAFAFLKSDAIYVEKILAHGEAIPIRRKIEQGEKLDFVLSEEIQVQYDWLEAVDNVTSIQMIKDALRQQNDTEKIEKGRQLLQQEFDKYDLGFVDEIKEHELLVACKDLHITSLNDLFTKLGEIQIFPSEVTLRLAPQNVKEKSGNQEKQKYLLECEVQRDNFSRFFEVSGKLLRRVQMKPLNENGQTFDAELEVNAPKADVFQLVHSIRREAGMRVKNIRKVSHGYWILFGVISLLWGLDPLVAFLLLRETELTPVSLTVLRFFSVAAFLGFVFYYGKYFGGQKASKSLPFLDMRLLGVALTFFVLALSTFLTLNNSLPSDYIFALYSSISVIVLIELYQHSRNSPARLGRFLICLILAIMGFGLFFLNPQWSNEGKILALIASVAFGLYSFLSDRYQKTAQVDVRYSQFQFYISAYCALFASTLLLFFSWPELLLADYIFAILFAVIFNALPYVLFIYLLRRMKDMSQIGMRLTGTGLIPLFIEMFLLGIFPPAIKAAAIAIILLSFVSISSANNKLK